LANVKIINIKHELQRFGGKGWGNYQLV